MRHIPSNPPQKRVREAVKGVSVCSIPKSALPTEQREKSLRWIVGPRVASLTTRGVQHLDPLARNPDWDLDKKKPASGEAEAGTKQTLRGISMQSKLAVARLLSSIDWQAGGTCLHITLTYHRTWPATKEELAAEKSWLTMQFGRWGSGVWRLEFQAERLKKFGDLVPHWHILLWIADLLPGDVEANIRKVWRRYSGNRSPKGVSVRDGSAAKAAWYLALHAAKDEQSPRIEVGRWWGYVQRKVVLGFVRVRDLGEVETSEAIWLQRIQRRFRGSVGHGRRTPAGFTVFLLEDTAQRLLAWLRTSGLPVEWERKNKLRV
jgi:hypothetical protein